MPLPDSAGQPWPPYHVQARNISRDAGPSVHSDDVARSLGFAGALVAGRAIYSHLLHPLLERFGEAMLSQGRCQVRFLKPAYEGEALTIHTLPAGDGTDPRDLQVNAVNGEGAVVASLEASLPSPMPDLPEPETEPVGKTEPFSGEKTEGAWELLEPGQPLAVHPWRPTQQHNLEWCKEIGGALPLFSGGASSPLHPGLVPTATTAMLHDQLIIRGWVHVSSEFITHRLLRAGQALELRATPISKWEKNGRHFVKLHVAVVEDTAEDTAEDAAEGGRICVEEIRTALIREAVPGE